MRQITTALQYLHSKGVIHRYVVDFLFVTCGVKNKLRIVFSIGPYLVLK